MTLDVPSRARWSVGRTLLPLAVVFLTVGMSTAVMGPFVSLFLSSEVRVGRLQVTMSLVGAPLAAVAASPQPDRQRLLHRRGHRLGHQLHAGHAAHPARPGHHPVRQLVPRQVRAGRLRFGLAQAFGYRWAFVFSVVLCGPAQPSCLWCDRRPPSAVACGLPRPVTTKGHGLRRLGADRRRRPGIRPGECAGPRAGLRGHPGRGWDARAGSHRG